MRIHINAICKCSEPKSVKELRRFLGIINFYWRFIPKAAEIQAPLAKFLDGPEKNTNTMGCRDCKGHNAPLSVMVDASEFAIGGVLQQRLAAVKFHHKKAEQRAAEV